ncbi:MAG: hypothetical protein WBL23_13970 [Salinisphaera sp.]|uniref:hypothetical protein n=1 Tax=Salinisphaera sp. TaxID=1914330 RepID=UPI003C7D4AA1
MRYRKFVSSGRGRPAPWQSLASQMLLGDERFVDDMQARLRQQNRDLAENRAASGRAGQSRS